MPTIIEALLITIGIDPKGVFTGGQQVTAAMKRTTEGAVRDGKAFEAATKKMADGLTSVRNQVLGVAAAVIGFTGLAAFVKSIVSGNANLGYLSTAIGMNAQQLSAWQYAMTQAGGTAADANAAFSTLQKGILDFEQGGDTGFVATLSRLGVSAMDAQGKMRPLNDIMLDLAALFKTVGPEQAQGLGAALGFPQAAINELTKGREAVQKDLDAGLKFAPTNKAIEDAQKVEREIASLQVAFKSLGSTILEDVLPDVIALLDELNLWLQSPEGQAKIKEWEDDIKNFGTEVNHVVQVFGGWETAIGAILALKFAGWAAQSIAALTPLVSLLASLPGAGPALVAAAVALGIYGGFKGAEKSGEDVAKAGEAGLTPAMLDEYGNAIGYKDKAGKYYTNEQAEALAKPPAAATPTPVPAPPAPAPAPPAPEAPAQGGQQAFYDKAYQTLLAEAQKQGVQNPEAVARLGAAQTAQETGYGRHAPNNNYFGIKGAGGTQTTQEFENGQWVTKQASFRGYASMEDSVADYIKFLKDNPRYQGVLAAKTADDAITAQGRTGYATDPDYAAHLASINARARRATSPDPSLRRAMNGGPQPDPSLLNGAQARVASNTTNNQTATTNTSSTEVHVGAVHVAVPSGDPKIIAQGMGGALRNHMLADSAATGLA